MSSGSTFPCIDQGFVGRDLVPDGIELDHRLLRQRLIESDEQLACQCVREAVDAVVVERSRQVLRNGDVVVREIGIDDEDHLVGDCYGGTRVA